MSKKVWITGASSGLGLHTAQALRQNGYPLDYDALTAQTPDHHINRGHIGHALVQLGSIRSGVLRVSARELWEEMNTARKEMKKHYQK